MREENNHTNPKRVKHGKISQDQKEEKKSRNTNKNDKNINVDVEKVDEDVPADLDRYCHIIDEFNRDYNGVSMFKSGPNYY